MTTGQDTGLPRGPGAVQKESGLRPQRVSLSDGDGAGSRHKTQTRLEALR